MGKAVVGLDLGVTAKSQIAVIKDGEEQDLFKVASSPKGLVAGLRRAAKDAEEVHVVVEATAMSWFVAAIAAVRSGINFTMFRVSANKSSALRNFFRQNAKTDKIDARVLARMPAVDPTMRIFQLPDPEQMSLKRFVSFRHKMTEHLTDLTNRVRSLVQWTAPGLLQATGDSVGGGLDEALKRVSVRLSGSAGSPNRPQDFDLRNHQQ